MRPAARYLLPLALFFIVPGIATATTYKCTKDGEVVYSSTPCGKDAQEVKSKVQVLDAPPVITEQLSKSPATTTTVSTQHLTPGAAPETKGSRFLAKYGLSTNDVIVAMLFLIPISLLAIFFLTRGSKGGTD